MSTLHILQSYIHCKLNEQVLDRTEIVSPVLNKARANVKNARSSIDSVSVSKPSGGDLIVSLLTLYLTSTEILL